MLNTRYNLAAALVAIPLALAQTFTDCDPTKKSCPNDVGFLGTSFSSDFTSGASANGSWSTAAYSTIKYGDQGAEFTIAKQGQAPTLETDFYIFFGKVEVVMQAAPGQGIVSSIVLESEDLDEIDWEFVGGDITHVQTNYYGKGNTTTYDRAIYYPIASPQSVFHTYTIDWTSDWIKFSVDGAVLRTINYKDANGGANFPQTPMKLKLGNWAGGAPGNAPGTIEWAGGPTDFNTAPFTMYVKSVSVTNYNPAKEYEWTDRTGSWQSIKVIKGDGSSVSAGSPSGTSSLSNTLAPTSFHSVKKLQQTDAAVSSTSSGAAPSTTVSSMMSSFSAISSHHRNATAQRNSTLAAPTGAANSTNTTVSRTSSGSSTSRLTAAPVSASTLSHTIASASATWSTSAGAPQQTANSASSNGAATVLMALGGVVFALIAL